MSSLSNHTPDPIHPRNIHIQDYRYDLPDERIARFPLPERDAAKLLVYRQGDIQESVFRELPDLLPAGALLLFNDTRVIQARIRFQTQAGDPIEVFCLEPLRPGDYILNFSSPGPVRWKALIGNNRKWKEGTLSKTISTPSGDAVLTATRLGRYHDAFELEFAWNQPLVFAEVLHYAGIIPLPPYLKRDSTQEDTERYQTVYAREDGSVAAPTAGLHFTERVFQGMDAKRIEVQFATLHVGAGTFKPVQAGPVGAHHMHQEHISMPRSTIEALRNALRDKRPIIPVGTTSLRILESLFWAAEGLDSADPHAPFFAEVDQWAPYENAAGQISPLDALDRLLERLHTKQQDALEGNTRILIAPGYRFQLASGLITNFHQPESTLLLLIAALIGLDWKRVYDHALQHHFRFLSYGDSSLLLP